MEAEQYSTQWCLIQGRNKERNKKLFRIQWKWKHNITKSMGHNESSGKRKTHSPECLQNEIGERIY